MLDGDGMLSAIIRSKNEIVSFGGLQRLVAKLRSNESYRARTKIDPAVLYGF